ncbi:uncharacterized protein LOC132696240 [Cylas formicarius]|uniref:uncharacterized protein LOC132696240 n=1 Tax=Cylas formicarius TaxID=197179 RepID=UPI002958678C|nr:uncharacterized protein LOC132696240 [Cylas formicarius]
MEFTNKDFCNFLLQNKTDFSDYNYLYEIVLDNINKALSSGAKLELKEALRKFCFKLKERYIKSSYNNNRFFSKNSNWLKKNFDIPEIVREEMLNSLNEPDIEEKEIQLEKRKSFSDLQDLSARHKRRKTKDIRDQYSSYGLLFAAKTNLRSEGYTDFAKVIEYLMENPSQAKEVREFCQTSRHSVKNISGEKAMSIFVNSKMSKHQYNTLRQSLILENMNHFPSYYAIQQTKLESYPPKEYITITEVSASVKLQALLDHTLLRILKTVECVTSSNDIILVSKWGFDGASGQSTYKQKLTSGEDSSIFISSLVPIKLYNVKNDTIIWENKRPSSTRYCRPLRFTFVHETPEVIRKEKKLIDKEIENLQATQTKFGLIGHKLLFTMIDGKICNTLTNTSSMCCYICGAKPKETNILNKIYQKQPDETCYSFGISSLHAWIRCMEWMLHISYNSDFKRWSCTTTEHKNLKATRKARIQEDLRNELGILVDVVKQGVGTTNDGNAARKFFSDCSTTSKIIGIDFTLLERIKIILQTLSCTEEICPLKFDLYTAQTAKLYVSLYDWYYMPPSVHKILVHGADIIRNFVVPIGKLSEEASEARHKEFRNVREFHARKTNRRVTNEDILHNLLLWSDPYISHLSNNGY